jgi:ketosteroid isomerase-like protein
MITQREPNPTIDLQALADRGEIEALRAEFADAAMLRDYDRFASLFTLDGAWRMPYVNVSFVGREAIRAGIERAQEQVWEYFVYREHSGPIRLDGDTAFGRAYVCEFGRMRSGSSQLHHSLYHDQYRRTEEGWRFAERVYEVRYADSTPLAGSPPGGQPAPGPGR